MYLSLSIIRLIKSTTRWVEHAECMGDIKILKSTLIKPKETEELCIANTRMGEMRYTKLCSFLVNSDDIGKVKYT